MWKLAAVVLCCLSLEAKAADIESFGGNSPATLPGGGQSEIFLSWNRLDFSGGTPGYTMALPLRAPDRSPGRVASTDLSISAERMLHTAAEKSPLEPLDIMDARWEIRITQTHAVFDGSIPLLPFGVGAVSHGLICMASSECLYRTRFDRDSEPIGGLPPSQIDALRVPYDPVVHGNTGSNAVGDAATKTGPWGILDLTSALPLPGAVWVTIFIAMGLLAGFSAIRRGVRK